MKKNGVFSALKELDMLHFALVLQFCGVALVGLFSNEISRDKDLFDNNLRLISCFYVLQTKIK